MDRGYIKELSREQIKGKIGILFIINLVMAVFSYFGTVFLSFVPFVGGIAATALITAPLTLGSIIVYLKVANSQELHIKDLFEGYYDLWSAFKVQFLASLFVILWSLLFIIPGIIKGFSYSMAPYILAENKGMSALEAISKSKEMMKGHKMEYFILELSFLGWFILTTITFGIVGIWVIPYHETTFANFYKQLKGTENIIEAEVVIQN